MWKIQVGKPLTVLDVPTTKKINGVKMEEKEEDGTELGLGVQIPMVWTHGPFAAFVAEIKTQTHQVNHFVT